MKQGETLTWEKEAEENYRTVQQMVLDSLEDARAGKGRDFKEVFDELGGKVPEYIK